ncbi:MAG TPA: hypothetical protein VMF66_07145 [Candidatus Acidoferrum sp.]|nr:hypothetical protein [Candidatus Acidoferrum sp.]
MSRKKKSLFAGCETKEQFIAALEQSIASGELTIAQQKTAALLAKMKGWDSSVPPESTDSRPQVNQTGVSLSEVRRQLAEGLHDNSTGTGLDWILNSPDEIFCERVERITGVSPFAAPEEREAHSNRALHEAVDFVCGVRSSVGRRIATLAEVHAAATKSEPKWAKPKYQVALEYAVSWQTPDGFCWSKNLDANGYGSAPHADSPSGEQVN